MQTPSKASWFQSVLGPDGLLARNDPLDEFWWKVACLSCTLVLSKPPTTLFVLFLQQDDIARYHRDFLLCRCFEAMNTNVLLHFGEGV